MKMGFQPGGSKPAKERSKLRGVVIGLGLVLAVVLGLFIGEILREHDRKSRLDRLALETVTAEVADDTPPPPNDEVEDKEDVVPDPTPRRGKTTPPTKPAAPPVKVGAHLFGEAVDAATGKGLDRIRIEAVFEIGDKSVTHRTFTTTDGAFRLQGLPSSDRVVVSLSGSGRGTRVVGPFPLPKDGHHDIGSVELGPGARLFGSVVDRTGRPVTAAEVTVADMELPSTLEEFILGIDRLFVDTPPLAKTITDSQGRYNIDGIPTGTYRVAAGAQEHARRDQCDVWINAVGKPAQLDFTLNPAAALRGRVSDAEGQPLVGARVAVLPDFRDGDVTAFSRRWATATDAHGTYRFDLPPGLVVNIVVKADGYPVLVERKVTAPRPDLNLRLNRGRIVAGRVVDHETEAPIEGVQLTFLADHRIGSVVSTATGDFETTLPSGRYKILLDSDGRVPVNLPRELPVSAKQPVPPFELRLTGGAEVQGRVVDSVTQKPLVGAEIIATRPDRLGAPIARARSGDRGRFRLQGVMLDAPSVWARMPGYASRAREHNLVPLRKLSSGEVRRGVQVRLEPLPKVSGRVKDDAGRPVVGALVAAAPPSDRRLADLFFEFDRPRVLTERDGSFEVAVEPSREGEIKITATKDGFAPAGVEIVERVRPGETVRRDVVMTRGFRAVGRVVDVTGRPLDHVRVVARVVGNRALRTRHARDAVDFGLATWTGADGRFALRLPPVPVHVKVGDDTVVVFGKNKRVIRQDSRRLAAETEKDVGDFVAALARTISGLVVDDAGRPPEGELRATRLATDGHEWSQVAVFGKGRFVFERLPAGDYEIRFHPKKPNIYRASSLFVRGIKAGTLDVKMQVVRK